MEGLSYDRTGGFSRVKRFGVADKCQGLTERLKTTLDGKQLNKVF